MEVQNIMKVIDIHFKEVSDETRRYLNIRHATYRDQVLEEHLINVNEAVDLLSKFSRRKRPWDEVSEMIINEINELYKLAAENDAAYVRFTP